MKRSSVFGIPTIGILAISLLIQSAWSEGHEEKHEDARLLRHVVMFKFKDESAKDDIKRIVNAFAELPKKIDEIHHLEFGENNSPEGLNKGLTHCFIVTFEDEAGRAKYLPHPAHKAFVEILKPHLDDVCVVDFWNRPPQK